MTPALEISGVVKDYRGLRPLRIERLELAPGDLVAILGLDRPAAETLVNLITGTTLPDRGEIHVHGQSTADINDSAEWIAVVDRFGIFSDRAVLLDGLSVVQNLGLPFSLEIEPPSAELRARAVVLAKEVGLGEFTWDARVGDLDASSVARVRFGRALALDPDILLLEHPTAAVPADAVEGFGRQVGRVIERRGASALVLTADRSFAEAVARRVVTLEASTGRLAQVRPGWLARFRRP